MKFSLFFLVFLVCFAHCSKSQEDTSVNEKPVVETSKPVILFFGDSLTEGLGLASREESYPSIIGQMLKEKKLDWEIKNAGLSGDTTSSGLSRLDWVLEQDFEVFILELGANDMMRGIAPDVIEKNLQTIIQKVRKKNPKASILLIPMKPFPNMGFQYGKKFEAVYTNVSKKEKVPLAKFLLEGVAGVKELNQRDGVHPTKEGHLLMAKNIFEDVVKILPKKNYTK